MRTRQRALRSPAIDAVIAEPPDADHSVAALAGRAGFSERQFTRVFRDETGTTPARFVETVRVEVAQGVLEAGDEALGVVSWVGFGSEETMPACVPAPARRDSGETYRARFRSARASATCPSRRACPVRAASRRVAGAITGRRRPVTGG